MFLGFAFVVSLTSCSHKKEQEEQVQSVRIDAVKPDREGQTLEFPGRVKAAQDMNLSFRVSGVLQRFFVEEGAYVHKGQLLAQLDPTDYQIQLNATEAEYKQVKAEAERVMALYKENGTTPNANDKAVYGLQQITAKYQNHKDQLEYTHLYAPCNGYVQQKLFTEHETAAAGMPILTMIGDDAPEVEINLPVSDYTRRAQFVDYRCSFSVYQGMNFPLQLISIAPKANANQLYTMRLRFLSIPKEARPTPGMTTTVSIDYSADGHRNLIVPAGAVFTKNDNKSYVFLFDSDSQTIRSVEVEVKRLCLDGTCILISGGLNSGDNVVSSGVHHLHEGEKVSPLPHATETNVGGLL